MEATPKVCTHRVLQEHAVLEGKLVSGLISRHPHEHTATKQLSSVLLESGVGHTSLDIGIRILWGDAQPPATPLKEIVVKSLVKLITLKYFGQEGSVVDEGAVVDIECWEDTAEVRIFFLIVR